MIPQTNNVSALVREKVYPLFISEHFHFIYSTRVCFSCLSAGQWWQWCVQLKEMRWVQSQFEATASNCRWKALLSLVVQLSQCTVQPNNLMRTTKDDETESPLPHRAWSTLTPSANHSEMLHLHRDYPWSRCHMCSKVMVNHWCHKKERDVQSST